MQQIQANTFSQVQEKAKYTANSAFSKVILPSNANVGDNQRGLYDKLKNSIVYNTTGYDREIRNVGNRVVERG